MTINEDLISKFSVASDHYTTVTLTEMKESRHSLHMRPEPTSIQTIMNNAFIVKNVVLDMSQI